VEVRNSEVGDHGIIAENLGTSRIMSYYIKNCRNAVGVGRLGHPGTSVTIVMRKTHKDHLPLQINIPLELLSHKS